MQLELNDDQVALLMDLLQRTRGDVEHTREEAEELIAKPGYATVNLLQLECRLEELMKTIGQQSGHDWVQNDVTQRVEPRYKAREEMGE
jgi:GTP cyclohydrolase II